MSLFYFVFSSLDPPDIWQSFPELAGDFQVPACVPMAHPSTNERTSLCVSWTFLACPLLCIVMHILSSLTYSLFSPLHGTSSFFGLADDAKYFSSAFRVSSNDTQMWTHYDIMDNILCEISGRKRVVMYSPEQVSYLYVNGSTSHVLDIDNPDYRKFPKFSKARPLEFILEPGACHAYIHTYIHSLPSCRVCHFVSRCYHTLRKSSFVDTLLHSSPFFVCVVV